MWCNKIIEPHSDYYIRNCETHILNLEQTYKTIATKGYFKKSISLVTQTVAYLLHKTHLYYKEMIYIHELWGSLI